MITSDVVSDIDCVVIPVGNVNSHCSMLQATIAAFAASEGHAHPRVVELPKVFDRNNAFSLLSPHGPAVQKCVSSNQGLNF